jgi:hypothetical protein
MCHQITDVTVRPFLHLAHLVKCVPPVVREGPHLARPAALFDRLGPPRADKDVRAINLVYRAIAFSAPPMLMAKGSPAIRVTPRTPGTLRRLGMCSVAATGRPRMPGLARGKMGKVGNYGKAQNLR